MIIYTYNQIHTDSDLSLKIETKIDRFGFGFG